MMVLAACSAHSAARPGVVEGRLPLCYGPGPDLNLRPVTVVEALQGKRVVISKPFTSTQGDNAFALTLAAGDYTFRLRHVPGDNVTMHVAAGRHQHLQFKPTPCL